MSAGAMSHSPLSSRLPLSVRGQRLRDGAAAHAELFGDRDLDTCAARLLPSWKEYDGLAAKQADEGGAHILFPRRERRRRGTG